MGVDFMGIIPPGHTLHFGKDIQVTNVGEEEIVLDAIKFHSLKTESYQDRLMASIAHDRKVNAAGQQGPCGCPEGKPGQPGPPGVDFDDFVYDVPDSLFYDVPEIVNKPE